MVRENNVRVDLSIDRTLWEVFKREISVGKPFSYKGLISEEAEEAFRNHITLKRTTSGNIQHTAKPQQSQQLWTLQNKIIDYMKGSGLWERYAPFIQEGQLIQAIKEIRGTIDQRTTTKWIRRLLEFGLLERNTLHRYKLIILDEEKAGLIREVKEAPAPVVQTAQKIRTGYL
jgi:hypothetical protein